MKQISVIVTGAASGIGLACARDLLADGYNVTAVDLNEDALIAAYPDENEHLLIVAGDVSSESDCKSAVTAAVHKFGQLNALIHFAGIHATETVEQLTGEIFNRVLSINVTGSFLIAQAASKPMIEQGEGVIVLTASATLNIGGVGGTMGQGGPAYASSKGAVVALTRSLARALGPKGIRVNAISPGSTATPMTEKYTDESVKWVEERTPLGRMGKPPEIGDVARFLITPGARFMTGEIVNVNGGIVMA